MFILLWIDFITKTFIQIWLFYQELFNRKKPLRGWPKIGVFKMYAISWEKARERWVTFFSKLTRWMPTTVLKMNSFTDILQEFYLDIRISFRSFLKFSDHIFYRKSFNNCLWSNSNRSNSACVVGFCTLPETVNGPCELSHPAHFINYIALKRMKGY